MKISCILIFAVLGLTVASLGQVKTATAVGAVDSVAFYNNTKKPAISDQQVIEYAPTIQADGKTMIYEASSKGRSYILLQSHLENKAWSKFEPLKKINTSADSTDLIGGPNLSFDGNVLYFFRTVGMKANHEIFYSFRQKDGWGDPVNLGTPVNSDGYEGFPSVSADGTTLYFVRQNLDGPQSKELRKVEQFCYSIYRAVRDKGGSWGPPERLPSPINQDCEKAPRIMADGRTLIFSSNRPGGKGGFDMYQTKLTDLGEWTLPENLAFVNTDKDDQLPCISAEGDLMFYTYNNNDIYSIVIPPALRQFMNNIVQGYVTDQDTKAGIGAEIIVTDALTSEQVMKLENNAEDGRYTIVLPVGRSFNIEFKKEGYSSFTYSLDLRKKKKYEQLSMDVQLFKTVRLALNVNDRELFEPVVAQVKVREKNQPTVLNDLKTDPKNGRINLELPIGKDYEIALSAPLFKGAALTFNVSGLVIYRDFEKYIELTPEKMAVMVNVFDLVTNAKVKSKVVIKNKSRDETIELEGNLQAPLRAGDRYAVEVTSDQGYAFNSTSIDLTSGKVDHIDVALLKLEVNAKLPLKDITFESNSDKLSDVSFTELNRVLKLMQENPSLKVEIAAHTDDIGSENYNLVLSNKRAKSVQDYLTENKIPSARFTSKGYGETQFKLKNDSDENRAQNRRVELKVLSI